MVEKGIANGWLLPELAGDLVHTPNRGAKQVGGVGRTRRRTVGASAFA